MEDMFKVGVITSTHGVKGEVKVFPTTDDAKRFKQLKHVILDTGMEKLTLEIEGVKFFKNMVILKFKEIDNIDDVQKYRQMDLYVERKNAVKLHKDEYFIADLIGIEVFEEDDKFVGKLTDVLITGANDVYVVELAEGFSDSEQKEVLLPAIAECIRNIDIEANKMVVHVMEGLLD